MIAILGGLGAAAAWAVSTLCSSRSSRLVDPVVVVAWVMVVGLVISAPLAAASGVPHRLWGGGGAWLLFAAVGNVGGLLLTYEALRVGQVALVAPVVSSEGAIAALIAVLAGETLEPGAGAALAVIAVGIWLASIPAPERDGGPRPRRAEGLVLALIAACTFGASLYATGRAGMGLPSSWVALSARLIGTVVIAIPLAVSGRLRLPSAAVPLVLASGICEVLGFYAYTAGSRHGIAIAAVLASQFGAIAAVAAYYLFGDRLSRLQVVGVVALLVGVAVLSALRG